MTKNVFSVNINGFVYYQTTSMIPLYLNIYGLCMLKGNCLGKLYFADLEETLLVSFYFSGKGRGGRGRNSMGGRVQCS